ncbi:MAG: DUF805 domain-containing protein [Robiginitomaculum sp.]|nr:DUF805 domain-containing protein [Robiginitomaculum sp.]
MNNMMSLFLSPRGRIGRKPFIVAIATWCVFYMAQYFWFQKTGQNTLNFFLALGLMVLNIHIIFCVFGKRLHDIGRSTWALMGVFMLILIVAVFVMLNFGGVEYFDTIMKNPDKHNDPVFMREVQQIYQDSLSKSLPKIGPLLSVLPSAFTLWLCAKNGHNTGNRYGPALYSLEKEAKAHE